MELSRSSIFIGHSLHGRGVFADRYFAPEETISEIYGEIIVDPDYESCYCMELDGDRKLEPAEPFRYLNHSCGPNCEIVGYVDDPRERDRLWLVALHGIQPGDELRIDYGWPAESAIPCRCGSSLCRGWIVDPDQLDQIGLA